MKFKSYILFIALLLGTLCNYGVVSAEDNSQRSGSSFVVSGNMPDNQISESGYFDLQVAPNDEQIIEVVVTNITNEPVNIRMTIADATTTTSGSVNYQLNENIERDSSLVAAFSDIASMEETDYTIAADSSITIPIKLEIPEEEFSGVVLGGITATEIVEENDDAEDNGTTTTGVTNIFSYSIAAMLTEQAEELETELVLNDVYAGQRNYRNYINANLQNIVPKIIRNMSVEATVYDSKGQIAYTSSTNQMKMAPNSNFDYGISLEETKFIPGDYSITMKVIADEKEFNFERDFTIEATNARQLNNSAVLIEDDSIPWYVFAFAGIVVCAVAFSIWQYLSKKKIN